MGGSAYGTKRPADGGQGLIVCTQPSPEEVQLEDRPAVGGRLGLCLEAIIKYLEINRCGPWRSWPPRTAGATTTLTLPQKPMARPSACRALRRDSLNCAWPFTV
ncbi:Dynein Heavy Chain 9, Axonemal [Manis pentadactyla]|nr:Dynein Heavy Chain 9, Axonemal [Manis pentadactyla]